MGRKLSRFARLEIFKYNWSYLNKILNKDNFENSNYIIGYLNAKEISKLQ